MVEGLPYVDFAQEDRWGTCLIEHLDCDCVLVPRIVEHVAEKPKTVLLLKLDLAANRNQDVCLGARCQAICLEKPALSTSTRRMG